MLNDLEIVTKFKRGASIMGIVDEIICQEKANNVAKKNQTRSKW